ncbi:Na/Pi cotransporter family protein [Paracoccus sp. (in: a-proteobacteria)]|uniref:Na/Pi cotransporter family protein n=1 Tax=Paracoccus sp. TaxID=267 RepID=UPI00396C7D63
MSSVDVALQIAGSVALLLFGLSLIRSGMDEAFGLRMKMILGFGTQTGLRAFVSGLIATLGLQSSTATALLTASFVKRDLIGGRMAQIILLGANVGTALTAVIISAGISAFAPVLVLAGYVLRRRQSATARGGGAALIGIGLMLISLVLLEEATAPIRQSAALAAFLPLLENAALAAFALSAVIAVLCSSSLAAVLLVASLALPPGLTVIMVLGANLGGAIPPVLATMADGAPARRLTAGNLAARGLGCLLAFPFATQIGTVLQKVPFGQIGFTVETHLAFNLVLALLIWPLVGLVTAAVAWLLPEDEVTGIEQSRWLDDDQLETPLLALTGASREVLAIGDMAERMMSQTLTAFRSNDTSPLAEVTELEGRIDRRQQEVKNYLSRLGNAATEEERRRTISILDYVINLEHVGDIIDKGLCPAVRTKIGLNLRFSDEGYHELEGLFLMTQENLRMAQTVFMTGDREMARQLVELKVRIRHLEKQSSQRHLIRLREGRSDTRETSSLHLDILRDLKRINAHAVSVAYPILDEEGLLIESRLRSGDGAAG